MNEEQNKKINIIQAYKILEEREKYESNLNLQRISIVLIINSFLFLSLSMGLQYNENFPLLLPFVSIIGLISGMSGFLGILENSKAIVGCHKALLKLEKEPEFVLLKKKNIRVFTDIIHKRTESWCAIVILSIPYVFTLPIISIWIYLLVIL